jgi:hypothetical protein
LTASGEYPERDSLRVDAQRSSFLRYELPQRLHVGRAVDDAVRAARKTFIWNETHESVGRGEPAILAVDWPVAHVFTAANKEKSSALLSRF